MSSGDLKEEYRRLQEQQKRKLERVKELRQAREQQQQQGGGGVKESLAFGINDDLGLQCRPADSLASDKAAAVEAELRDRVRGLDDENARLKKLVSERDFEVAQMRKKLAQRPRPAVDEAAAVPSLGGAGGDSGAVAVKVMELSRKVRELTAEVESERSKAGKAARRVKELEARQQTEPPEAQEPPPVKALGRSEREELELELRRTKERLAEQRTQQQSLTRELRLAKKALAEETGLPEANLRELLAGTSPGQWRGRQQQIIGLEEQVRELKRQVAAFEAERLPAPTVDLMGSNGATTLGREALTASDAGSLSTARSTLPGSGSSRQHAALLKMQKERRERAEQERAERAAAAAENAELKRKADSLKARNQTLASEMKALRGQVETLLRKGKHDDELIESLTKRERALHELLEQNLEVRAGEGGNSSSFSSHARFVLSF